MMYDKWWKHNRGDQESCDRNDKNNKESKANALDVDNIGKLIISFSLDNFINLVVAEFS